MALLYNFHQTKHDDGDDRTVMEWNNSTRVSRRQPDNKGIHKGTVTISSTRNVGMHGERERNVKSLILRDAVSKIRPNRAYELRKTNSNTSTHINGQPGIYRKI